jgi:hypothetical protein
MFWAGVAGAALLCAAGSHDAAAQRAVESPSSEVGGAVSTTPPPPGFPVSQFVYGGDFQTHLQGEITKPDNSSAKGTVFDDSDLELYGNYSTWLSLYSDVHLERNRNDNANDYFPDSNTFFRSGGLTLRQLFAMVRPIADWSVYGGKIHPAFGSAWEVEPGNFYNFASDYEQTERIGFGVQYRLPDAVGLRNARLSVETFFLDTSILSNSLISRPSLDDPTADRLRRYTRDQFGPSNTGGFSSYTIALRGGQPSRGLTYQLSFTQEATDDPAGKRETGEWLCYRNPAQSADEIRPTFTTCTPRPIGGVVWIGEARWSCSSSFDASTNLASARSKVSPTSSACIAGWCARRWKARCRLSARTARGRGRRWDRRW